MFKRFAEYLSYAKKQQWLDTELVTVSQLTALYAALQRYDKSQDLLDEYLRTAQTINNKAPYILMLAIQLDIHDENNNERKAVKIRKQYKEQALRYGTTKAIGYMYAQLAQSFHAFDDIANALLHAQKGMKVSEKHDNLNEKALAMYAISAIYESQEDYQHAVKYNLAILDILLKVGDKLSVSTLYNAVGNNYIQLRELERAKSYVLKSLVLSDEMKNDIRAAHSHHNLANISFQQGQLTESESHFKKAIGLFKQYNDNNMVFDTSLGLAKLLLQQRQFNQGITALNDVSDIAKSHSKKSQVAKYYDLRYLLEKQRKNFRLALLSLERSTEEKMKIYTQEKETSLQKLIVKYEASQMDADNKLLHQENELKQLRLTEQESQNTILLLAFSIALVTVSAVTILLFKQRRSRNQFKSMALLDELTGAPNRRAILDYGHEIFAQCETTNSTLTVAMIDIDYFKRFNDDYGHDVGDIVLKIFSTACESSIRNRDQYGRFGGEEWLLILTDAQEQHIQSLFDRINLHLEKAIAQVKQLPSGTSVTFSLGTAQYESSDVSLEQLIKRADENLYKAKTTGRNKFVTDA